MEFDQPVADVGALRDAQLSLGLYQKLSAMSSAEQQVAYEGDANVSYPYRIEARYLGYRKSPVAAFEDDS